VSGAAGLPLLCVDFETRSHVSIRDLGARVYAAHPTTSVICACFAWKDADTSAIETLRWVPENGWASAFPFGDLPDGSFTAIAHNHYFDARVTERLAWPRPARWVDTSELARRAGMPSAALEWLGPNLLGIAKDMEGNKLMRSLSRLTRPKRGQSAEGFAPTFALDPIPVDALERTVDYCEQDAIIALRLYLEHFEPWDHVSDLEDAITRADRAINGRGVCFDRDLARRVLEIDAAIAERTRANAGIDDPTDLRAPQRFLAAMAALGVQLSSAQKAEVEPLLEHPDEAVAALAAARLSGATIARGKLQAGLLRTSADGHMRDMHRYFGAHPGRFAGSGFQLQNLPK
jgi:DNA polymerase bacteriophage-type